MSIDELEEFEADARAFQGRFRTDDPGIIYARRLPQKLLTYSAETLRQIHTRIQAALEAYPADEPAKRLLLRVGKECPLESLIGFVLACEAQEGKIDVALTHILKKSNNNPVFAAFCEDMRKEKAAAEPRTQEDSAWVNRSRQLPPGRVRRVAGRFHTIVRDWPRQMAQTREPDAELESIIELDTIKMSKYAHMSPEMAQSLVCKAVEALKPLVDREMQHDWRAKPTPGQDDRER